MEVTVHFDEDVPDSEAGRVTKPWRATSGQGYDQFIPHSALLYNESWNTEFLKNDSLEFQVIRIEVPERLQVIKTQQSTSDGEDMAPSKCTRTELETEKETMLIKKVEYEAYKEEPESKTMSVGTKRVVTRMRIMADLSQAMTPHKHTSLHCSLSLQSLSS